MAYVMSRFPKLTETFILQEILAMERAGVRVELFPLLRQRDPVVQPEAVELAGRAFYQPFLSAAIVRSNLRRLIRQPRAYLGSLAALVRGTWGSVKFLGGGLAIFPKVVHMAGEMERRGVRHIHCHFANHPAAAGFILQRLTGIPFSFTAHGTDLHVDRHMLREKVREAAFVVAISNDNRSVITAECGAHVASRVKVIHCGVDTARFTPADGDRPVRPFTITSVGTLHEVKGQRFLVEASARLRAEGLDVVCRFVGDGPDRAMLEAMVGEAGLADRVVFEGARTGPAVAAILRGSDVLVAPSVPTRAGQREGIPVVLMEAMSAGLPVVASRISGIPELVQDEENGLLVPPRDSAGLATAIRRLHDDPTFRATLGRNARATVVAGFDAAANARRLKAEIEATIGARATAARRGMSPSRAPAFSVALVGPDGAGKSTIARQVAETLPMPAAYLYMGVNPAAGGGVLPTTRLIRAIRVMRGGARADDTGGATATGPDGISDARVAAGDTERSGPVTTARSLVRLVNRLAEEWYRQAVAWSHLARGTVVLFDRHFYADYHASDIKARRRAVAKRIHGLVLARQYPKPDLLIMLDAPAHVLHERKGEGTLESLERRRQEYLDVGRTVDRFVVIDATRPREEVAPAVTAAILEFARSRERVAS